MTKSLPDLEKVASGASGACGHFVVNHAILRSFKQNILFLLMRMEKEELKMENLGWIKEI